MFIIDQCRYYIKNSISNLDRFNELPSLKKGIVLGSSIVTAGIALPIIGRFGALIVSVITFTGLTNYLFKVSQNEKDNANKRVFTLFNKEMELFKSEFKNIGLKNSYWCFIEGSNNSPNNMLTYRKSDVYSRQDDYLSVLKGFEDYSRKNLDTLNPDDFAYTLKFALVEKKAEDDFNVYSYDRETQSKNGVAKSNGGINFFESVPKDAADGYCKEMIQENCPFDKI